MNSVHCSRCVCVCVSTAPCVCVCLLLQVCVCLCEQCPLLQVCVCVCSLLQVCVCLCALGWVKYREHISLLVILCIIVYVTKKIIIINIGF